MFTSCDTDKGETPVEVLKLDIGKDQTILDNETATLTSNVDADSYLWSTGETTKSIEVNKPGKYWLRIKRSEKAYSDTVEVDIAWRMVNIETVHGEILLWLHQETANHKESFLKLVNEGYFNSQTFNRVINHFVIQGGCVDVDGGFKDTSLFIEPEFFDHLVHVGGALGGGRDNNPGKKTNGCQFYIVDYSNNEPRYLDGDYTIFGMVASGKETVETISGVKTDNGDKPLEDIPLKLTQVNYTGAELLEKFQFKVPE